MRVFDGYYRWKQPYLKEKERGWLPARSKKKIKARNLSSANPIPKPLKP